MLNDLATYWNNRRPGTSKQAMSVYNSNLSSIQNQKANWEAKQRLLAAIPQNLIRSV